LPSLRQQSIPLAGPTGLSVLELHPGSVAVGQAPLPFLIGKTGQAAQVPPIGAGQVSSITTGQVTADGRRHGGLQGRGADPNPGLPVSWTALEHYTRLMPVAAHGLQHRRLSMVQIDQDITGIAFSGKGLQVNLASLPIPDTQEAHRRRLRDLRGGPQAFSGKRPAGGEVDEANQIKFPGHGAQLPPNGLCGDKQSTIDHRAPLPSRKRPVVQCVQSTMTSMRSPGQRGKNLAGKSECCISPLSQKRAQSNRARSTQFDKIRHYFQFVECRAVTTDSPVSNRSVRAEVSLRAISNRLGDLGDLSQLLHIQLDAQAGPVVRV